MKPGDVEAAVLAIVAGPAATRIPQTVPSAFTRISVAGGSRINLIQARPTVLVECYALTEIAAQARAAAAWKALDGAQHATNGGVWFGGIDLSWPVAYADPSTPTHYRYQFTASVVAALSPN